MTREPWPERAIDWFLEWVLCWPLAIADRSGNRWLRVLVLPFFVVWAPVAAIICIIPLLVLFAATMVVYQWRGKP